MVNEPPMTSRGQILSYKQEPAVGGWWGKGNLGSAGCKPLYLMLQIPSEITVQDLDRL